MQRIDTSTKAEDLHGAGKHGFQASGPGGVLPTQLSAEWCDDVQEEIANAIEGAGLTLGSGQAQLLAAIIALASTQATLRANPTGQVAHYFGASAPSGWVKRHGGTIGNASSGGTERAHADTEALFTLIWSSTNNTDFPVQDSAGSATTRGGSAAADFAANKRMPLPDDRGLFDRGLNTTGSGIDPSRVLATIQLDAMQGHRHDPLTGTGFWCNGGGAGLTGGGASSTPATTGDPVDDGTNGTPRIDDETRPANRAYLAIIKL